MKIIAGWKTQLLSQAGRACLIKSVALAMPSYVMSSFLLPQGFCSELDFLVSNFWWGFPMEKKVVWDSGNSLILTKLLFLNWDDRSVTMKRSFGSRLSEQSIASLTGLVYLPPLHCVHGYGYGTAFNGVAWC